MKYLLAPSFIAIIAIPLTAQEPDLPKQAADALRKAVKYFDTKVAPHGAYVWQYTADLKIREGEGRATKTMGWVQPPGTPSVGLAILRAFEATRDKEILNAAMKTAMALVKTRLRSGGWDYRMEFDPKKRKTWAFAVEKGKGKGRNTTTLDDNNTQEALRFLIRFQATCQFALKFIQTSRAIIPPQEFAKLILTRDAVYESSVAAMQSMLKAQYPNGAWPQRFSTFPDPKKHPVKKANYPKTWSRTYPSTDYRGYYTLNDNTLADMIDVMLEAGRVLKEPKYTKAALKAGDFILLAQMPEPQPAWAQQYNLDMQPAWARKFEPPAITGGESYGVMRTLLRLYRETGDKKYLKPIPKALAFFKKVQLPNGQLARFYELETNKPLYFTKQYKLTYSDDDLPTHYGFKVSNRMDRIAREYGRVLKLDAKNLKPKPHAKAGKPSRALIAEVKNVIAAMDDQGRWTEKGKLRTMPDLGVVPIITTRTFIRNVDVLSSYLQYFKKQ